jgi:PPOX class probable F420-dependent enzyme
MRIVCVMRVSELDRLSAARYVALTSYRDDGSAVNTAVWLAREADHLYVLTHANSGKVARIESNADVELSPCDVRGRPQGTPTSSSAWLVTDPREVARAKHVLKSKYRLQYPVLRSLIALQGRTTEPAVIRLAERSPS